MNFVELGSIIAGNLVTLILAIIFSSRKIKKAKIYKDGSFEYENFADGNQNSLKTRHRNCKNFNDLLEWNAFLDSSYKKIERNRSEIHFLKNSDILHDQMVIVDAVFEKVVEICRSEYVRMLSEQVFPKIKNLDAKDEMEIKISVTQIYNFYHFEAATRLKFYIRKRLMDINIDDSIDSITIKEIFDEGKRILRSTLILRSKDQQDALESFFDNVFFKLQLDFKSMISNTELIRFNKNEKIKKLQKEIDDIEKEQKEKSERMFS